MTEGPNVGPKATVGSWLLACTSVAAARSPYWQSHGSKAGDGMLGIGFAE